MHQNGKYPLLALQQGIPPYYALISRLHLFLLRQGETEACTKGPYECYSTFNRALQCVDLTLVPGCGPEASAAKLAAISPSRFWSGSHIAATSAGPRSIATEEAVSLVKQASRLVSISTLTSIQNARFPPER